MRQQEDHATEDREEASRQAPWRPSPFLSFSLALHAAALLAVLARPRHAKAVAAGLLLDHVLLSTVGMLPRTTLLGPNLVRLPPDVHRGRRIALTFDDGPDPNVTPRVLDLLDRHDAQASFFCIGQRAERHADLTQEIVRRGHMLENHTYHHPVHFAFHGPHGLRREIREAQQILTELGGRSPQYFRAPAGIRNPLLDRILHDQGLRLTAWTRRGYDTVEGNPRKVLRRLARGLGAGDILLLHDGSAAPGPDGRAVALSVLPSLLETIDDAGLVARPLPDLPRAPAAR